jgi:hypothetical protein
MCDRYLGARNGSIAIFLLQGEKIFGDDGDLEGIEVEVGVTCWRWFFCSDIAVALRITGT